MASASEFLVHISWDQAQTLNVNKISQVRLMHLVQEPHYGTFAIEISLIHYQAWNFYFPVFHSHISFSGSASPSNLSPRSSSRVTRFFP